MKLDPLEQDVRKLLSEWGIGPASRLLVAISGGLDSVVLSYLLHRLGYKLQLAHVNYHLRGEESNQDEQFVWQFADFHQIPLQVFDRPVEAAERRGRSVQELAREIRYSWLATLLDTLKFDFYVTGHQADDQAETLLMQLGRGAGLTGLGSMPAKTSQHLRPLLGYTRTELEAYANRQGLRWVDDSSNAADYYLRNRFRQRILPVLKAEIPGIVPAIVRSAEHLQEARLWLEKSWWPVVSGLTEAQANGWLIRLEAPLTHPDAATLWHMLLHRLELPMSLLPGCMGLRDKQKGRKFETGYWRIIREQDAIRIQAIENRMHAELLEIESPGAYCWGSGRLTVTEEQGYRISQHNEEAYFDIALLTRPLLLRHWESGDQLQPFGLNGHKKVSDLYTDAHIGTAERQNFPVLCSAEEVIWVAGVRRSAAAPVTENTRIIWKITWQQG